VRLKNANGTQRCVSMATLDMCMSHNIICTLPNPACFMVVKLHGMSKGMAKYWFIREQQASG